MAEIMYNKIINKPSPIHYIVLFIVFLLPPHKNKKYLLLEKAAERWLPFSCCSLRAT